MKGESEGELDREGRRQGETSSREVVRRNPCHVRVEGETVQLLELVKGCHTSKRKRARANVY